VGRVSRGKAVRVRPLNSIVRQHMNRRLNWKGWAFISGSLLVILILSLLISGNRVLIWETKVEPGQTYLAGEWGDLGKSPNAQLVCRYFTGRSITMNVLWYSSNNIMGRDSCPFLVKE
jgi:hypothetical protein